MRASCSADDSSSGDAFGTGSSFGPYPPVDRVIGTGDDLENYLGELDPPHGRYGVSHLNDVYGFSKLTCIEY